MWQSYLLGIGIIIGLVLAWSIVQAAWARSFPEATADPDVLARRLGCSSCGCTTVCERERDELNREEKA